MDKSVLKISYSFGMMDLLHVGHIMALKAAKDDCDLHIFGLVKDDAIIEWNGSLLSTYEERKKTLESIKTIDEIIPQDNFDPSANLKLIHEKYPDAKITLYRGTDWKFLPAEDFLNSINGEVKIIPYYNKLSPDKILEQMRKNTDKKPRRNNIVSTKASTLLAIRPKLTKSKIEDILVVTESEFNKNPEDIYSKIKNIFKGKKIVVRSSCSMEDGYEKSNAGCFESILNVKSDDKNEVKNAILEVADSYKKAGDFDTSNEQILIQTQTEDIKFSGVIFTRDIKKNRPYYLINYDDSGSTNSVTAGISSKSIRIAHNIKFEDIEGDWKNLLIAVSEIENILSGIILDIEFAIKNSGEVVIFQVRPLAANYKFQKDTDENAIFEAINREKERYISLKDAFTNKPMIWSDMAFWNPAEIIGTNPKTLDFSLYKEIITHRAWNEGLVPMGYKEVKHNLMRRFGNKPYISLEYSFRSLIPDSLSEDLTLKLIDFYSAKLKNNLKLHDKIEFEIVLSCLDFETDERLKELKKNGFSEGEIKEIKTALNDLTQKALSEFFDVLANDKKDLYMLDLTRQKIEKELKAPKLDKRQLIDYFRILIGVLQLNGTPLFARQARYAFIAKSFCRTLVSKGFVPFADMENFMLSISTVASEFSDDLTLFLNGKMGRDEFILKYGHLRAGTYDITTDTYAHIDFSKNSTETTDSNKERKEYTIKESIFSDALKTLNLSCDNFGSFIKTALEQREYFKFEFTKTLSLAIEILAEVGELMGFSREDLSHLAVADIYASGLYTNDYDLKEFWSTLISQRREVYKFNTQIELPAVIVNEKDFNFIKIEQMRPNFITDKIVNGEIANLEENKNADIEGKIVVIDKADPGYDWIFTKNIKGLITKYGGVASHMAIRCSEFGLPAAIGCGEKIYQEVSSAQNITLNCKDGKITKEEFGICAV